jgi:serine/threonine-protein kinase
LNGRLSNEEDVMKPVALALACLVSTSALAAPAGWVTYRNERFGSTAEIPAGWQAGPPPENRDGLRFVSPDGRSSVAVSGSLHSYDSVDEALDAFERPKRGERITYKIRRGRWLVVSGFRGGRIFYRKLILGCRGTVWNGVDIDYPAGEKRTFDPLVTHISKSLRAGPGYDAEGCS